MPDRVELSFHFVPDTDEGNELVRVALVETDGHTPVEGASFLPSQWSAQLADLRWYLETQSHWPSGQDMRRAGIIEGQLSGWGRSLLAAVIQGDTQRDSAVANQWQRFISGGPGERVLTIFSDDPYILRLPWELLADKRGWLVSQGIKVRRQVARTMPVAHGSFSLPLRVLNVTCRPEDAAFLDVRALANPLLEAGDVLGDLLRLEFLYPPTYEALRERLLDVTRPVHIFHFDGQCEGAFRQGFFLFEDEAYQTYSVDADTLGVLLANAAVPIVMFAALPGTARDVAMASHIAAARLIKAGVAHVLTTGYPMQARSIGSFSTAFFNGLVRGVTVACAVEEGRLALLPDEGQARLTPLGYTTDPKSEPGRLQEWFVPNLFQKGEDQPIFSEDAVPESLPGRGEPTSLPLVMVNPGFPGRLPESPRYGFHGRARELLRLERTLAARAIVVLRGFAGVGKTALAAEAGKWLYRTGRFPAGVVYISFDRGGSLSLLCLRLAQAISNSAEFAFDSGIEPAEQVTRMLPDRPLLMILDHLEAVSAYGGSMPVEEIEAILTAVRAWCLNGGLAPCKALIVTSDLPARLERALPILSAAVFSLQGLTGSDGLDLAAGVLDNHGIDRTTIDHQAMADLIDHIGGLPVSLYLVLPLLRFYAPALLSARFEALQPGFTTGAARSPEASLTLTLDNYLRRLGDDVFTDLPLLTVFAGGAMEAELLAITGFEPGLWHIVRASLLEATLLTIETLAGIGPPFIRFHPALTLYLKFRARQVDRAPVGERHWRRYLALARHLYREDHRHPRQARAIALREMPNLQLALLSLGRLGYDDEASELAAYIADFLAIFGRSQERDIILAGAQTGQPGLASELEDIELPPWALSLVVAVVGAIEKGDEDSRAISDFLSRLETAEGWRSTAAIQRILQGERDRSRLPADLEPFGEQITGDILRRLATSAPPLLPVDELIQEKTTPGAIPQSIEGEAADAVIAAHIREEWDPVIKTVTAACRGDAAAASELPPLLARMSQDDDWRELAITIQRVLDGERDYAALLSRLDDMDTIIAGDILRALNER